jgi:hypothetical protein
MYAPEEIKKRAKAAKRAGRKSKTKTVAPRGKQTLK